MKACPAIPLPGPRGTATDATGIDAALVVSPGLKLPCTTGTVT